MMPKRPFLCRIGLHRWSGHTTHDRCDRPGCHRARILLDDRMDYYLFDQFLCSCGCVIVPLKGGEFWRNVNNGEVCNNRHWHEPAR